MTVSAAPGGEPPPIADTSEIEFVRGSGLDEQPHLDWVRCARLLTPEQCSEIVAACSEFPLSPPTTVGEDRYPGIRQADTRKVGVNPRTRWLFDLLCDVAGQSSGREFALDLTELNREPQYVEYRPGWGHFDWHNDYSHGLPNAPRKLTLIIQLSSPDEYEGGELQLFRRGIEDLPDDLGVVLAFPSFLYHRVTPVTRGLRRALVAWIGGPRLR